MVDAADERLLIPIAPGMRSLNVAVTVAMALGEALRDRQWEDPAGSPGKRAELVSYAVKEIFLTLQGEGAHAGRAAVFCRFSGCNLWTGREQDRATRDMPVLRYRLRRHRRHAGRPLCVAAALADAIAAQWGGGRSSLSSY